MRMVEGRRKSSVSPTVCGSHWLACCNKELITSQEAFQVHRLDIRLISGVLFFCIVVVFLFVYLFVVCSLSIQVILIIPAFADSYLVMLCVMKYIFTFRI